jgi:hypothetical protein
VQKENKSQHKVLTEFIGLKELDLDPADSKAVVDTTQKYADKFSQLIKNDIELKLHIKEYKTARPDKEHKYSVKVHLLFPSHTLTVDKVAGWDIRLAVQNAMKDMEERIQHTFHPDKEQRRMRKDERPV